MEAVFARETLPDFVFGLPPGIKIAVERSNLIKNIHRLVATLYLPFLVVSFKSVGLNNEVGIIVICRNLRGFPRETVNIAMAIPLSDNNRTVAIHHVEAVKDNDNREVGFGRTTAHVNDNEVSVGDFHFRVKFGFAPHPKHTLPILTEADIFKGAFALIGIRIHIAYEARRTTGFFKFLYLIFIKHHRAGVDKRLSVVRGKLGGHNAMVVFATTLLHVCIRMAEWMLNTSVRPLANPQKK